MELRHFRYFVAVAETCHFGRAAERLHMAQPALSQAIRQLEAELEAPLFTRTTRQVSLTPAGEFLLEEARRILHSVDLSATGVRRVADGRRGLARVGFTGTASFSQLPFIARTLQQELPEAALEVNADLLTPQLCEGLREGNLDLAVLRPPVTGDGIAVRTIEAEPLVLALPADHRLAAEPVISMSDLRTESFVLYAAKDSAVNEAVLRSCHDAGFSPRREHLAPGTAVLLALVAAGLGLALVPGSARALPLAGVVFREVGDAGTVELALAWREQPTPLVRSILTVLQEAGLFTDHQGSHDHLPEPVLEGNR
ncbi:MAG TPA: LysR substrate-binding domain-containing protein [Intrasporangium sp.]|uniref:LysR substrate-binding domain-containing protein n=1 Tax=Intrasporangium sp. TaxID=1925024 RepID=UPI002D77C65D|nr:LysR substrate-binding domain-containing protein [Intrasporangium sp.]HET7398761.1 LysR substrate-binding domain-containing protein [Intrasporangium sp.]